LPFTAAAQTAPEFPGLRGLTTIQAYIGFIGRTAAIAECGFTEPYVAELMANVGRELAQAGVTLTPGAEQVQMTDGLLLRSPGYTPGLPTLAITAGTLSVSAGGTSICAAAIGFVLRASGTGVNITATGNRFDGEVAVWIDDAAQLRDATSIPAAVRGSILQTIQGLVRSITAANAMAAACPGPLNAVLNVPPRFTCTCSASAASTVPPIWGIDVYTDDSPVCVAAVHAGAIGPRGGTVTVSRAQGQQSYPGGARNGVVSNSYGPWQQSFRVTGAGGAAQPPAVNNQRLTK
jgi:hypothetical protein